MIWYDWRWWRFALSDVSVTGTFTCFDEKGIWKHVVGRLWMLVQRNDATLQP
jgi:hypothetical protein